MKFIQYSLQVALKFCCEQRVYVDIFYAIHIYATFTIGSSFFKISNLFNKVMTKEGLHNKASKKSYFIQSPLKKVIKDFFLDTVLKPPLKSQGKKS